MNLETAFNYATHHSESIIQWVFLAILLLSGLLIARGLMGRRDAEAAAGTSAGGPVPSPELEGVLNKIMEQTAKLEALNFKDMKSGDVAAVDAQVQALKMDLSARESEIAQLKAAGSAKPSEDAGALNARIKELEGKLAEYEILEDDIADLSLYKEENVRLRGEVERLKAGGASAGPAAGAPAPVTETQNDIVAEFAQNVAVPSSMGAAAGPAAGTAIPDTGDPMKDFESTVKLERALQGQPEAAAPGAPPRSVEVPPSPPAPAAPSATQGEVDDLFAEFSQPAPDASLEGSTLDTDKMMAEMAALVNMEPHSGNALEESIDIDKMADEAGKS